MTNAMEDELRDGIPLKVITRGNSDSWQIDPAPDRFDIDVTKLRLPSKAMNKSNSFTKAIGGREGSGSKARHEAVAFTAYEFFDVVEPHWRMEWLLKLYENSAHYAAVQAKVSNIVGLGYELADSQQTRDKLDQLDENSEEIQKFRRGLQRAKFKVMEILDELNDQDFFFETLVKVVTDFEVFGNCYLEVGRQANGQIGYVGHVPAATMRVRRVRDGYIQLASDGKPVFFRNFGDLETANPVSDEEPNEIIHIKKYHPASTYYGVPDIIAALTEFAGNKYAAAYNLEYFENKAVPKYIMTVKGRDVSDAVTADMFDFFEANFRGKNHRLLVIPIEDESAEVEFKPIETGVQDSSFNTYYTNNIAGILMAHRVPITKISMMIEGVNVALAKDADKTFKEQVCQPIQRQFEKHIAKIVKEFTNAFRFKLNELALTDEKTQAEIDDIYLRNGSKVPNEVRSRWGWPGLPWGDEPSQLSIQAKDDAQQNANRTRERDANRRRNTVDSTGGARNAAGEGRAYQ